MKTLMPAELPGLPREVRALVAEGVYSLYEISASEPRYVLLTAKRTEYYFLSSNGDLMQAPGSIRSLEDLELGMPVTLPSEGGAVRINVG